MKRNHASGLDGYFMTIKIKESVKFKNLIENKFIFKPEQIIIIRYCIN